MSSFEVVGVVLGAVPLLISGLEHYNDGLVPIKDIIRYEYVVKELIRALNVARCRLRNTCEKLLNGLVDDDELAILLNVANVGGDEWKRPDLDRKLQQRLDESYDGYMATIAHLAQMIFAFAKKMGLDSKFRPTWIEREERTRSRSILFGDEIKRKSAKLWKRVKLCLDHKEFQELIKEMAHENLQLELLTQGNLELEPIRRVRTRDVDLKYWNNIRDFALRLYNCLVCRWSCHCEVPHRASLRLDPRNITPSPHKLEQGNVTFGIVFFYGSIADKPAESAPPWKWRQTEIMSMQTCALEPQSALPRPATGRNVSFDALSSIPLASPVNQALPKTSKKINNFCSMLAEKHSGPCELGYLEDFGHIEHHVSLYAEPIAADCHLESKSLAEIMSGGRTPQSTMITPKDRHELALLLASTLLQLYNTPWLSDTWTKKDIHMFTSWSGKSLAKSAYVNKILGQTPIDNHSTADPDLSLLRNVSVFNLGIALLELTYGHPIEDYETEQDLRNGARTVMTNRLIAERLLGKIEMYEGKRYSDIVHRCVYCDFGSRSTSFENAEFRHNFYVAVVVPLTNILHDFLK